MLLAAIPATPVQLAHACYRIGFEVVVPASWGDELVAHAVLEDLPQRGRDPVIQCTCPLVTERLLASGQHLAPAMVRTAAPPVAAANYARDAFAPRVVNITYIGACPGAQHNAIDQRCLPDEFLRMLNERDVVLTDMPEVFDSVLPPDRRRFVSLPGGCPTQEALWHISDGRMLREVTQSTFSTDLAQTLVWREYVMIDVAPSLGCACAGSYSRVGGTRFGRVAVTALEPPRASQPVVSFQPEFARPQTAATPVAEVSPPAVPSAVPPPAAFAAVSPPAVSPTDHDVQQSVLIAHVDHAPQMTNGPEPRPAADDAPAVTNPVRVRTPPSSPLPRAYLAKRRHLTPPASQPAQLEALNAEEPLFQANNRAPEPEHAPVPNEAPDSARPIAVHVEPEPVAIPADVSSVAPAQAQETITAQEPPPAPDLAQETILAQEPAPALDTAQETILTQRPAPAPDQAQETILAQEPAPARDPVQEAILAQELAPAPAQVAQTVQAQEPPPTAQPDKTLHVSTRVEVQSPTAVVAEAESDEDAAEEPWKKPSAAILDEPTLVESESGTLRVEVEVEVDTDAENVARGVIIPDAVREDVTKKPTQATPKVVARPIRAWADLLIAVWLVLVASAVIASLLWRR
jgi:Iron only hydrogenase large subunit, C-terminal domain